ncbi:MAG: DUF4097 domain-containing protein [Meiothermus silvanus]|nr:DUF4097 domain-containing protein [Allomeiothermus silvanus]
MANRPSPQQPVADLLGLLGIGTEPTVQEDHALNLGGIRQLEAHTFNGSISVRVGTAPPHLTIRRKGDVSITLEPRGDSFYIEARKNSPICPGCGASFELTLPESLILILHSSNGAIHSEGSVARLEARTSNGAITVKGSGAAELKLHTSNGRISVMEAQGPVSAKTSNGAIELRQVEGAVEARTSNGAVVLEGLTLPPGSQSRAATSNGSVKVVGLQAPGGLEAEGHTSNGSVSVELQDTRVQARRQSFSAQQAGGNPAKLWLESSNGSISMR